MGGCPCLESAAGQRTFRAASGRGCVIHAMVNGGLQGMVNTNFMAARTALHGNVNTLAPHLARCSRSWISVHNCGGGSRRLEMDRRVDGVALGICPRGK